METLPCPLLHIFACCTSTKSIIKNYMKNHTLFLDQFLEINGRIQTSHQSEGKTLVTKGKTLVTKGKTLVTKGKPW